MLLNDINLNSYFEFAACQGSLNTSIPCSTYRHTLQHIPTATTYHMNATQNCKTSTHNATNHAKARFRNKQTCNKQ